MPGRIISVINYKGGVGKTTTTYHIGCSLAYHYGKKVLVIDIDPQTNLTFLCATIEKWQERKNQVGTMATLYRRYLEKRPLDTKRFIWRSPIAAGRQRITNLDLIPCDIDLLGEDLCGGQITGTFPTMELMKRQAAEYLRDRMFMQKALVLQKSWRAKLRTRRRDSAINGCFRRGPRPLPQCKSMSETSV